MPGRPAPGPLDDVPPEARVATVLSVFRDASTSPAHVTTADGAHWVLKFAGAGPGPTGLLTEFLALGIAAAFGAPVPSTRPLWLPQGFPWMAGTDEFDAMLQRSYGWNLGIAFLPDARPVAAAEIASCNPHILDTIANSDALLQNVDRTAANPNLLMTASGLRAIDYDACLYLGRALGSPRASSRQLAAGHLLAGRPLWPGLPSLDLAGLVAAAPAAWVDATGTDPAGLTSALGRYVAGWQTAAP